ncbi:hypothetical protein [Deinococcus rufus]|uniref:Uncharacterized protein n=1 Tax=Deinococcus rufus TaxID=2136097 RepID=A0ABV7ZB04_9DEIO
MPKRTPPAPRPRYRQTHPDTLATTETLRTLGLKPGTTEPDALLDYEDKQQQRSGTCALFLIEKAVPVEVQRDHSA